MKAGRGTLVDLLDRLLDRGAYLRADVVVTVAGVPLLGLSLQLLIGAVDTMVEYGVFGRADPMLRSGAGTSPRLAAGGLPAAPAAAGEGAGRDAGGRG